MVIYKLLIVIEITISIKSTIATTAIVLQPINKLIIVYLVTTVINANWY